MKARHWSRGEIAACGAAAACGIVGWLDWIRSGSAGRSSYSMFRSLQGLGLDQLTPLRVIWFLVPVAALAVVALVLLSFPRAAAVVLMLSALVVGAAGAGVLVATSSVGGVSAAAGPWLALGAAAAAGVSSLWLGFERRLKN